MPYKLVHVKFSQVPPNTYFTYKGNPRWVKSIWKESIREPHNAYRDDYGATPRGQDKVWWKLFEDDDIVQVEVMEV
jgi:hypothetical protein